MYVAMFYVARHTRTVYIGGGGGGGSRPMGLAL